MDASGEFVVIGEDDGQAPMDFAPEAAATVVVVRQTLFEERGDWDKGDEIGVAHGVFVVSYAGEALCNITFLFGEEDTIAATGVLPIERSSVGAGVLSVSGGTGRYKKVAGEVRVEIRNPKKYRFDL